MKPPVGLIGLGLMGHPMGANLLKAGHELTVWNRTASRGDDLVAQGAKRAATPREVGRGVRSGHHHRQRSAGAGIGVVGRERRVCGTAPRQRDDRIEHRQPGPGKTRGGGRGCTGLRNFWKLR